MFKEHAACLGIQQPQVSTDVFMFKPKFKLSLYWEASAIWLYLIILALNAKKKIILVWLTWKLFCLNFLNCKTYKPPKASNTSHSTASPILHALILCCLCLKHSPHPPAPRT